MRYGAAQGEKWSIYTQRNHRRLDKPTACVNLTSQAAVLSQCMCKCNIYTCGWLKPCAYGNTSSHTVGNSNTAVENSLELHSFQDRGNSGRISKIANFFEIIGSGRLSFKLCQPVVFFSHNKSANSIFRHDFSNK